MDYGHLNGPQDYKFPSLFPWNSPQIGDHSKVMNIAFRENIWCAMESIVREDCS